MHIHHIAHTLSYVYLMSFILVAVVEDSSMSEIDKEEEEQTTQVSRLATGKAPIFIYLELTLDVLTS